MPAPASQPLIDVFQGIGASRQRSSEKAAELSMQDLERIAHEHYYNALAAHEANLDETERGRLALDTRKQTFLESEDSPAARRERAQSDTNQRLLQKQGDALQRGIDADAAKRWEGAMKAHATGENPSLIAGGLPEVERQRFIDSVKAIQAHEYDQRKAATDASIDEQVDKLHQAVPGELAALGALGPLGSAGASEAINEQLAPQIAKLTYDAHKKLGEPPGPDDWMDYVHPAFREKKRLDDQKIAQSEEYTKRLASQIERDKAYAERKDKLGEATVKLRLAQAEAAQAGIAVRKQHEKYYEKFGNARITNAQARTELEKLRLNASKDRTAQSEYWKMQAAISKIAGTDLHHDLSVQQKLQVKVSALEDQWKNGAGRFQGWKEVPETINGQQVFKVVKPDGSDANANRNPQTPAVPSEAEMYRHWKIVGHDLNKDGQKDPQTPQSQLDKLGGMIEDDRAKALIGADPSKMKALEDKRTAGEVVKIGGQAEYDKLPSGTIFIGPDGKKRRKP